jgi:hypothetical protein
MAKVKLDTKKLQQLALEKGERVGLAVAAAVMVLFLGYGVWTGLRASSPEDTIKKATDQLALRIESARPTEEDRKKAKEEKPLGDWIKLDRFDQYVSGGAWFDPAAGGDTKRRNPTVLPPGDLVAGKLANVNTVYLQGGVLLLDYNPKLETLATLKPGSGGGSGLPGVAPAPAPAATGALEDSFARVIHPTRMVVVSATFPYRDQLEVCRKALRMTTLNDLFAAEADPRFLGVIVYRQEVLPDGKTTEPKALYDYDQAKDRTVVLMPETEKLLTTALYDEASASQVADYTTIGLVTPLPKFENASYPPLALAGIEVKEAETTGPAATAPAGKAPLFPTGNAQFPGMNNPTVAPGTGAPAEGPLMAFGSKISVAKLPDTLKPLQEKLKGNIEFFDPAGRPLDEGMDTGTGPMAAPPPMATRGRGRGRPNVRVKDQKDPASTEKIPEKILVRFFDADVLPGKTYQYSIQVRMANPNHAKKDLVAYPGLAEIKELESPFTTTPTVTIPNEYFVYAVDTSPKQLASQVVGPRGAEREPTTADKTAIQIHRWVDKAFVGGKDNVVADWVIAERLLVHRGEKLARDQVEVELPVWNELRAPNGKFELAISGGSSRGRAGKAFRHAAPVDFKPADRPPSILVDFEGGKRPYLTLTGTIQDEASTELLILNPDGKLVVQTSRDDSDPDTPSGKDRASRYGEWRNRLNHYRSRSGQ